MRILGISNGGDLADTAIRALEGGALSYNGNPSKSTLIIHSVQRVSIELLIYQVDIQIIISNVKFQLSYSSVSLLILFRQHPISLTICFRSNFFRCLFYSVEYI